MAPCGYRRYHDHMPTKIQRFRYDNDSWNLLEAAAPDGNRSAVISQLIDWYLGYPWAELPERPNEGKGVELNPRAERKEDAVRQFREWYDRKPGIDFPDRPPKT